jgi:hypothetical protein
VTKQFGEERSSLKNVILTPNTPDMRPIYARAKVLLALSLWWESFGRVAAEAAMNGIPVICTKRGGLPEAAGNSAVEVDLPQECFNPPYTTIPKNKTLDIITNSLLKNSYSKTVQPAEPKKLLQISSQRMLQEISYYIQ